MKSVLLLSAYDVDSHRRWRQGLVRELDEISFTELTLPARHFRWRIRGNPASWTLSDAQTLSQRYDAVVATSMVDCATLRGLYPSLCQCPWILYFHENQFAFPLSDTQHASVDPAMVNLYSAMACDQLVFNSDYNRDSFFRGAEALIRRLPDQISTDLLSPLQSKTSVVPVPLEDELFAGPAAERPDTLTLVWNHRVEYDKGLSELHGILAELARQEPAFRLILLGQRFRQTPPEFARIEADFDRHIVHNGYAASRQEYWHWLHQAHAVLSTAQHEFQGLAVMEAVALGCVPVVPDRLSYPQWFGEAYRYQSVAQAVRQIRQSPARSAPDLSPLRWRDMAGIYRELLTG